MVTLKSGEKKLVPAGNTGPEHLLTWGRSHRMLYELRGMLTRNSDRLLEAECRLERECEASGGCRAGFYSRNPTKLSQ